jgi:inosose dehydratase
MAIRIACHAITWGRTNLREAMEGMQALGFHGGETFADVVDDYGLERVDEFKQMLAQYSFQMIALYGGGRMNEADWFEQVVAYNVRIARFLSAVGANRLVLGGGTRRSGGPTRDDLLNQAHCMNEIGRRTLEHGVLACCHPHVRTTIEKLAEIDFVMEHTDPRYVALCLDTAHLRKGNPDVATAEVDTFRKYADRVKYVHLKDWDPKRAERQTVGGAAAATAVIRDFVELGLGVVDLKGCVQILRESNFDGWLTIELDYSDRTPFEAVSISKAYMEKEIGLSA